MSSLTRDPTGDGGEAADNTDDTRSSVACDDDDYDGDELSFGEFLGELPA